MCPVSGTLRQLDQKTIRYNKATGLKPVDFVIQRITRQAVR